MDPVMVAAVVVALAIPLLTLYLFLLLDVFSTREPRILYTSAAWGATGAFLLAYAANQLALDMGVARATQRAVVAPLVEEPLKAVLLLILMRDPRVRYVVDSALYGMAIGLGFAFAETVVVYVRDAGPDAVAVALSRGLSTALMHATATGLVGSALGIVRRSRHARRAAVVGLAFGAAVGLHMAFNALAASLDGGGLLLVAVAFGIGGGVLIAGAINASLLREKRRFAQTLGLELDVSLGERQAVQNLGGAGTDQLLRELRAVLGDAPVDDVRRLLILQANIGILQYNLATQASARLKRAWQGEIAAYQAEMHALRQELSRSVRVFLDSVFPPGDDQLQAALETELAQSDPTLVHTFDLFMRVSELASTFTAEQLLARAERLSRIDLFSRVPLTDLENLSRAMRVEQFPPGHAIFREGEPGNAMYLVEVGQIDITVAGQVSQVAPLRTFGPGEVVGELALLDGRPRSATGRVRIPTTVLTLPREAFVRFVQSRPGVVLVMLHHLAGKVRYTTHSVETAVAALSRLTGAAPGAGAVRADLPVSEYELPPEVLSASHPALDEFTPVQTPEAVRDQLDQTLSAAANRLPVRRRAGSSRE